MQTPYKFLMFLGGAIVVCFCAYGAVAWSKPSAISKQPHIIFILADDMGWNDVSFHGANQIPTPNIDALAYNGVILNRHYVLPICTPSRSALMTGRYPIRDGMQGWPMRTGEPRGIPLNVTLLPEHLRRLGYETRLVGKWHVGYTTESYTPTRRGFDSFFGYYNGFITYYDYWIGWDDTNKIIGYDLHRDGPAGLGVEYDSEYFTDLITTEAEKIIKNNGNDKPLFLEMAHLAVHTGSRDDEPLEVRHSDDVNATFPYIKDVNRRKYAGMLKALDESVGRVVNALSKAKMLENSIIVFISDNGAPTIGMYANTGSNYPMRGIKGSMFEGAARGAACVFSPLIRSPSRLSEQPMHIVDWLPTLYAAAGGKPADLPELGGGMPIDGLDQWRSIVSGAASPRNSILVNIDEVASLEGAIVGRHKLIKGVIKNEDGYYGESGNDPSYPAYRVEDALSSVAGAAISRLTGFVGPSPRRAQKLRERSTLRCKSVTVPVANCSTLCLFDIVKDPCETQDLSKKLPIVVKKLEAFIIAYRKESIPQTNTAQDLCALPKYFNGTWMPWRTEDVLPAIASNTTCHHPVYKFLE